MSFEIIALPTFKKELKKLSKKFPSLKSDFASLLADLETQPTLGKALGGNCYKIRMAIASKGRGKSGGARVITYVQIVDTIVYLLAIYDKGDKETLTDAEIKDLLSQVPE